MQDNPYAALVESTKRFALLAETLERNAATAAERHAQSATSLQQSVERAQQQLLGSAQQLERMLREQLDRAVEQAIGGSVRQFDGAVQAVAKQAKQTGDTLRGDQAAIASGLKAMLWKVHMIAIASTCMLAIGGSVLIHYQFRLYQDARERTAAAALDAEVATALRRAQVTSCGGNPCLKLDLNAPRWGKQGEYVLLDSSPQDSVNKRSAR